ncbi:MAG: hypothetical protein KAT77_03415 [Nanoarchaeota archaeon]|nr:hypothetical protein [Nanoarchaeota archaeon]
MSLSIINHNCLDLNDKLAYWSRDLSHKHLLRIENHVIGCEQCFNDLYGPKEQLIEMSQKLKPLIQYE